MNSNHGLAVDQEVSWRYESREGYGFVKMVKARICKLNTKTVTIEVDRVIRQGTAYETRKEIKNVKYENIKESDNYVTW